MKNYLLNLLLISCLFSSYLVAAPKSVTLKSGIDAISVEGKDYFIAGKVRFYEGNSIVKGDINLDYEEKEDENSALYYKGIIVDGDLRVEGTVFNNEDDYGKFLDVRGDLYVDNLLIGGAQVKVQGNIYVKYFTIQTYNHGTVWADAIYTPVLIAEERTPEIKTEEHINLFLHPDYTDPKNLNYSTLTTIFKNNKSIVMKLAWEDSDEPDFSLGDFRGEVLDGNAKSLLKPILDYQKRHFSNAKPEKKKEDVIEEVPSDSLVFIKEYASKVKINDDEVSISELTKVQLKNISLLDLSDNELKEIPSFLVELENLKHLDLSKNHIKETPEFLSNLKHLKVINLESNQISNFTRNISQLTSLTHLNLASNEIRVLPKHIKSLQNLETLNLGKNAIVVLSKEIGELHKLKNLSLTLNDIDELPSSLYHLSNLEMLDLSYCYTKISDDIENLTKLTELNISRNSLKKVSASILKLKNLKKLNLRETSIKELPENFSKLTELEWLDLGANHFNTIPKVLADLKKLKYLEMFLCRITQIPDYIRDFKNLKELRIDGNDIKKIQNIIFPALTSLDLNNNDLTEIPSSVMDIKSLEELDLGSNDITTIPNEIGKLVNLKSFEIGGYESKISSVPKEFSKLKALTKLDLSSNEFKAIPVEIFELSKLSDLDMGYNQISEIPKEISQLQVLESLSLGKNKIRIVPNEIADLPRLESLSLYENPIRNVPQEVLDEDVDVLQEYLKKGFGNESILEKFFKDYIFIPAQRAGMKQNKIW
ncbi:MAG: leucine-rich repeat domain-containing protein [Methylococcales bacterium]